MPEGNPCGLQGAGQFAFSLAPGAQAAPRLQPLLRRLQPLIGRPAAVAIDLSPDFRQPPARLVGLFERSLSGPIAPHAAGPLNLCFSLPAVRGSPALLSALAASRRLGYPSVIARVPDELPAMVARVRAWTSSSGPEHDALALWNELTLLSWTAPSVQLALCGTSRSCCAFSPAELPGGVLPESLFEVPHASAWLSLRVHLGLLASASSARRRLRHLSRALRICLRLADELLDQSDWPDPEIAADARTSRRVAIHLTGIGDLIDRDRLDPRAVSTLRIVEGWLAVIRSSLLRESRSLAAERGSCPILAGGLAGTFGAGMLRHRHLLACSPFALLPVACSRWPAADYFHLLPALRQADSIGLYEGALRHRLSLADYRRLLRMTWALARNRA